MLSKLHYICKNNRLYVDNRTIMLNKKHSDSDSSSDFYSSYDEETWE